MYKIAVLVSFLLTKMNLTLILRVRPAGK